MSDFFCVFENEFIWSCCKLFVFLRICMFDIHKVVIKIRKILFNNTKVCKTGRFHCCIDAVFFDKNGNVLFVQEQMKPWRFGRYVGGSRYTLELPGGTLAGRVQKGDKLIFSK